MIIWSDVLVVAPELSTVPSASQAAFIADAYAEMNPDVWGAYLDRGAKYLAAHKGAVSQRRGQAGPTSNKRVGQVGQANAVVSGALESTGYGEEFLRILNTLPDARGPQAATTPDLGPVPPTSFYGPPYWMG